MTTQNFFILTGAEVTAAEAFNTEEIGLGPREIDAASPGVGLNLNPDADDYGPGDPVALTGKFVATQSLLSNPDYTQNVPGMLTELLKRPWVSADTDTIFLPPIGPG